MSQKNEVKDLSNLVGANVLDHYLTSMQEQLVKALKIEDQLSFKADLLRNRKRFMEDQLKNLHELVALLAGNRTTRTKLAYAINHCIRDIRDPYFFEPLYNAHMTNLICSITKAFEGNFGKKEDVQLQTLLVILSKVSIMRESVMVPEKYRKMLDSWDELEDGE